MDYKIEISTKQLYDYLSRINYLESVVDNLNKSL